MNKAAEEKEASTIPTELSAQEAQYLSLPPPRTAHARAKADAADQAALAARQECDIARAVARELSPDFYQPGPDYIKQRFQEGVDVKENPEEKVPEKPPSPKESPHFYRKGTTPPRSPEASPKQSHSPPPSSPKPMRKQNPSSGARLSQDKRSMTEEQVTAIVNKPLTSKAPSKELGATVPKYSGRHHVPNPSNGELHSQYHGYYVKLNTPQHPPEDGEDESGASQSSSALVHRPSPNKWNPPQSVTKPVAKESKAEPKAKKSELAIPKNPASSGSCPSEKEANSKHAYLEKLHDLYKNNYLKRNQGRKETKQNIINDDYGAGMYKFHHILLTSLRDHQPRKGSYIVRERQTLTGSKSAFEKTS
ncbi:hypothetical protein STEG23_029548 [Scotinomys teguina]